MESPRQHGKAPTAQEQEMYSLRVTIINTTLSQNINSHARKIAYLTKNGDNFHTWRSLGRDGAGKENLPRATTVWKSQRGENTILQNEAERKYNTLNLKKKGYSD